MEKVGEEEESGSWVVMGHDIRRISYDRQTLDKGATTNEDECSPATRSTMHGQIIQGLQVRSH